MSFHVPSKAPQPSEIEQETTGPVAADSLAAESIKGQGGFAENSDAMPLGVKGGQSTLNTTDTSGATVLPPAADGTTREKRDALSQGEDVRGASGLKYPDGAGAAQLGGHHSDTGEFSGDSSTGSRQTGGGSGAPAGASDFGASTISSSAQGPDPSQIRSGTAATQDASSSSGSGSTSKQGASSSSGSGPSAGAGVRPHVDAAPNYVGSVTGAAAPEGAFKPKGANLEDADQTDSIPQTKTFVGAVGTVNVSIPASKRMCEAMFPLSEQTLPSDFTAHLPRLR
jgi:hypothetical protein